MRQPIRVVAHLPHRSAAAPERPPRNHSDRKVSPETSSRAPLPKNSAAAAAGPDPAASAINTSERPIAASAPTSRRLFAPWPLPSTVPAAPAPISPARSTLAGILPYRLTD
ncbi:uncharacterized protein METZ01_LOCUS392415, partial [marine metagenome]